MLPYQKRLFEKALQEQRSILIVTSKHIQSYAHLVRFCIAFVKKHNLQAFQLSLLSSVVSPSRTRDNPKPQSKDERSGPHLRCISPGEDVSIETLERQTQDIARTSRTDRLASKTLLDGSKARKTRKTVRQTPTRERTKFFVSWNWTPIACHP